MPQHGEWGLEGPELFPAHVPRTPSHPVCGPLNLPGSHQPQIAELCPNNLEEPRTTSREVGSPDTPPPGSPVSPRTGTQPHGALRPGSGGVIFGPRAESLFKPRETCWLRRGCASFFPRGLSKRAIGFFICYLMFCINKAKFLSC